MNEDELKNVLHEVLDERSRAYEERHDKHHEFLDVLIAKERAKVARMEKVKTHVIGWGIVTGIGGIGYAIFEGLKAALVTHK